MNPDRRKFVTEFFSKDDYLRNSSDRIKVRSSIIKRYISDSFFTSVLDVGCGDGSLSLPYCAQFNSLMLNDLSVQMLSRCIVNADPDCSSIITTFQGDIFDETFPSLKFDLIICVGVIAHVDDPIVFLQKLDSVLEKGGMIIVETTENPYPVGAFLSRVKLVNYSVKQDTLYKAYPKNRLPVHDLNSFFINSGYEILGEDKFSIPLPTMSKWPHKLKYFYTLLTWKIPFLSYFGSEYVACFKKI